MKIQRTSESASLNFKKSIMVDSTRPINNVQQFQNIRIKNQQIRKQIF